MYRMQQKQECWGMFESWGTAIFVAFCVLAAEAIVAFIVIGILSIGGVR